MPMRFEFREGQKIKPPLCIKLLHYLQIIARKAARHLIPLLKIGKQNIYLDTFNLVKTLKNVYVY